MVSVTEVCLSPDEGMLISGLSGVKPGEATAERHGLDSAMFSDRFIPAGDGLLRH